MASLSHTSIMQTLKTHINSTSYHIKMIWTELNE